MWPTLVEDRCRTTAVNGAAERAGFQWNAANAAVMPNVWQRSKFSREVTMGHLILLGAVVLAGMLGVKVGELAGRLSGSTLVASLTSFLL